MAGLDGKGALITGARSRALTGNVITAPARSAPAMATASLTSNDTGVGDPIGPEMPCGTSGPRNARSRERWNVVPDIHMASGNRNPTPHAMISRVGEPPRLPRGEGSTGSTSNTRSPPVQQSRPAANLVPLPEQRCPMKWCPGAESNHRHCDFQSQKMNRHEPTE
jgi:hypothetical protein